MNTEHERAEFEAWYMREFEVYPRRNESGGFRSQYVNAMFKSWKGGRAALQSHDSEVWLNRLISLAVSYGDSRHFEAEADDRRDAACRSAQALKNLIDHARRVEGGAMNINIIDAEKEIRITRAEYEREYQEYLKVCMFMVDPPSFEVWLARRWERRRFEGDGK